jgi:hypothetical protein
MKKVKTLLELPEGNVEIEGYKCPNCGEEVFKHEALTDKNKLSLYESLWGPELWLE